MMESSISALRDNMVNQMLFGKRKPPTGDGSAFRYLHGMSSGYLQIHGYQIALFDLF